jgi:hypothetical protein
MLVEDLRAQFDQQSVGVQTQRKALMLLQGILRHAVVRGLTPANPRIVSNHRNGRCWARTSDLRLVEAERRGQGVTG